MSIRSALHPPGLLACSLLLGVLAAPAGAVDGVLEINQTCAVQTGCFAGDAPGFPVAIAQPGSYRLTGDLAIPDENTAGIVIALNDGHVTLDLNGFAIGCPTCTGPGTGTGIEAASNLPSLTIRNGTVANMGAAGIGVAGRAHVERIRAESNAESGIFVGPRSIVVASTAIGNGESGITCGDECVVRDVVASANGADGILTGLGSRVSGSVARQNLFRGIFARQSVVADNAVVGNASFGIDGLGSVVRGNAVRENANVGLASDAATAYAGNSFNLNNGGDANPQVSGAGHEVGTNVCGGDTTCP